MKKFLLTSTFIIGMTLALATEGSLLVTVIGITIAMNHNCVPRGIAERYTDSELKEVLRQLKLKADF